MMKELRQLSREETDLQSTALSLNFLSFLSNLVVILLTLFSFLISSNHQIFECWCTYEGCVRFKIKSVYSIVTSQFRGQVSISTIDEKSTVDIACICIRYRELLL